MPHTIRICCVDADIRKFFAHNIRTHSLSFTQTDRTNEHEGTRRILVHPNRVNILKVCVCVWEKERKVCCARKRTGCVLDTFGLFLWPGIAAAVVVVRWNRTAEYRCWLQSNLMLIPFVCNYTRRQLFMEDESGNEIDIHGTKTNATKYLWVWVCIYICIWNQKIHKIYDHIVICAPFPIFLYCKIPHDSN